MTSATQSIHFFKETSWGQTQYQAQLIFDTLQSSLPYLKNISIDNELQEAWLDRQVRLSVCMEEAIRNLNEVFDTSIQVQLPHTMQRIEEEITYNRELTHLFAQKTQFSNNGEISPTFTDFSFEMLPKWTKEISAMESLTPSSLHTLLALQARIHTETMKYAQTQLELAKELKDEDVFDAPALVSLLNAQQNFDRALTLLCAKGLKKEHLALPEQDDALWLEKILPVDAYKLGSSNFRVPLSSKAQLVLQLFQSGQTSKAFDIACAFWPQSEKCSLQLARILFHLCASAQDLTQAASIFESLPDYQFDIMLWLKDHGLCDALKTMMLGPSWDDQARHTHAEHLIHLFLSECLFDQAQTVAKQITAPEVHSQLSATIAQAEATGRIVQEFLDADALQSALEWADNMEDTLSQAIAKQWIKLHFQSLEDSEENRQILMSTFYEFANVHNADATLKSCALLCVDRFKMTHDIEQSLESLSIAAEDLFEERVLTWQDALQLEIVKELLQSNFYEAAQTVCARIQLRPFQLTASRLISSAQLNADNPLS